GIFATKYYFERRDEQMLQASAEQQSAEGNLIKEIKKETEQRLAEKESEIRSIQENMKQIESERLSLEANMNSKISEREAQLQAEMEAVLAAEREKLQSRGMSVQQIDEQIEKLKMEQNNIFDQELAKYREEAQLEKIELEESLDQLQNEYNSKLSSINEERTRIEAEAKSREEELTARMEARTRELETERTEAQQELQALTEMKEQETLVENQIIGFYKNIENLMKVGKMDLASVELRNLQNYLYDDSVIGLDGIKKRREIDIFVIDSLSKLIEATKTNPQEELDTMSLIDAADRLKEIRQTVGNADQQMAVGNREMAELMYRNALEKIPEINRSHRFFLDAMEEELESGYAQLDEIQTRFDRLQEEKAAREKEVVDLLARADGVYKAGNYSQALETYKNAIEATGFDNMNVAAERLVSSGSALSVAPFKEKVAALTSQVENLNQEKAGLQDKLAGSDEKISRLNSAITLKDTEISGLNDQLLTLNEDLESKDAQLSQFNRQLEGRSGDLATLNEELDTSLSEITSLTGELDSSKSEITSLSGELETSLTEISSLNDKLAAEQTQVLTLKEKITTYEERIEDMRRQLEEEKSRVTTNQEDSRLIDKEMAELTTLKTQLNRLNRSYTDFELIAGNLERNLQGDASTIEALYDFFDEDAVEDVMPGIGEYLRSFSSVYINAGQEIGLYEAVSLLYDLNGISSISGRIRFLNDKKSEYSGNEAMIEIITQLQQSLEGS
ncbi:MAG: hypothetical protein JXR86_11870, partial [Spirochaetales bacterium]|nr:hypothetical protein [Spirochaetales bacterium]